jgi:hypothetical protein
MITGNKGSKEWFKGMGEALVDLSKDLIEHDKPEGAKTVRLSATVAHQIGEELVKLTEVMHDGEEEW